MKKLSVVVIFHDMRREARRTLHSLCTRYQTGVDASEYEVIVIDNGSTFALSAEETQAYGPNFRYHFFATDSVSPVDAINAGVRMATGEHIAAIVDGARMATPGLIWSTLRALLLSPDPFICSLSWHLGPDIQGMSMQNGYDQDEENRLLDSINWPEDGYRLFEISTLAPSSSKGFLAGVPPECSWFAMPRSSFLDMAGFDARFRTAGGGLMNHDFRNRAIARLKAPPILLLGEGVFHQFHGGVATNSKPEERPKIHKIFRDEYRAIHDRYYLPLEPPPTIFFGKLPTEARKFCGLELDPVGA